MSPTAIALVMGGAVLHALWNMAVKRSAAGPAFVMLFGWISLACMAPLALWHYLSNPQPIPGWVWVAALASALIHVVYSLVLQHGYRQSDFAVVYPVARGTGPLLAVVGSVLWLGEAPAGLGWLGIGAITVGVLLTAGMLETSNASQAQRRAGVLWGGMTGVCIAAYTVVDGWAIRSLGASPLLFFTLVLAMRVALMLPWTRQQGPQLLQCWQQHRGAAFTVGVLSPAAYILVLIALQFAPLSYVAPAREVSMLMAAGLGARYLGESLRSSQVAGAVFLLVGVLALALA